MPEFKDYIGKEYINGFLQGAIRRGLDVGDILRKAGLPLQACEDSDLEISGIQLYSLIQAIKEATNDIYLGFPEYPAKLPMDAELAEKAVRSETLGEAIKAMSQFIENYRNDFSYAYILESKAHEFCLALNYKLAEGLDSHIIHFYRLTNSYRFCSWLIGNRIKLSRVRFPEPQPEYCFDYRKIFHCDIEFNQPQCQLCFDDKYLRLPVVRKASELIEYTIRYNDWFVVPGHERSLTNQVEQILVEYQKENNFSPPIEVVAQALSMNPRTIRRTLARENESYQKIKSRMRCDLAIKLLLTTEIPIAIVAERVGFAEPGDFTRAFAQWTGSTPSTYRSLHRENKKLVTDYVVTSGYVGKRL